MRTESEIAGKRCIIYADDRPGLMLVQPTGEHEIAMLDDELDAIRRDVSIPFVFVGFEIADWELELMPFHDEFVSKRPEVGVHSDDTLRYLTDGLVPYFQKYYGSLPIVLGGYSLAGLFSLWACTRADMFASVAACSPSLWVNGWVAYAERHPVFAESVYLSLGDREERTRNQRLAVVGDCLRAEYALLQQQLGEARSMLAWEQGGHFNTPHLRLARGFAWCANFARHVVPNAY